MFGTAYFRRSLLSEFYGIYKVWGKILNNTCGKRAHPLERPLLSSQGMLWYSLQK